MISGIKNIILLSLLLSGAAAAQDTPAAGGPFCPIVFQVPERPLVDVNLEEGDTYLDADSIDLTEEGISNLSGSVEMSTDTWQARADAAVYDDSQDSVDLSGNVKFWEESLFLAGESAQIDVGEGTATVSGADYYLPDSDARGRADKLFIDPGALTSGEGMSFSTCAPANGGDIEENFWRIDARSLTLNHDNGSRFRQRYCPEDQGYTCVLFTLLHFSLEQNSQIRFSRAWHRQKQPWRG